MDAKSAPEGAAENTKKSDGKSGIKHWPASEQPREKLLRHGPQALSDAELVAIFLRTGCQGMSAVALARTLLSDFGGLRQLLAADKQQFCKRPGLGPAKFVQLQAVLEMAGRHLGQELERQGVLDSPRATEAFLANKLRDLRHEVFVLLYLDNQHRVIHYEQLFRGTIDGASVYPREIVKKVLKYNAAAVILSHNHPSGIAEPSQADVRITHRIREALALIDVRVLDHLIIGDGPAVSMAERGLL